MAIELRNSGIDILGNVPWGTHFCHFYETKQDLLDTLVPYFKAGLESKEFCVWVVSNSELITVAEVKKALAQAVPDLDRHLADENIEILKGLDWYLAEDVFNLERVTRAWDAKLKRALARGYDGMRVSGDTFWLAEKDWSDFFAYEKQLNDSITDQRMTVLCTYPLAISSAAEVLDVVQAHQFAIARRQGEWEVIEAPELIQAKAEIKRLNEELEQRVVERTNELRAVNEELRNEIAERKLAESLYHAKEQEFRAIVENAPDQIIRYDREFRRTYVNPAVAVAYGLPAEALLGKPIGSVIEDSGLDVKQEELAAVRARIAAVFETAKSIEYEMSWQTPVGRRHFNVRLFPELDLNGLVINVLGIARDITERKQAEEALRQSEQLFRQLTENIRDVFWMSTPSFDKALYISRAYESVWGRTRESLYQAPRSFLDAIHAEDRPHVLAVIERNREQGFEVEYRITQPDGSIRWILDRGFPIKDETGRFYRVAGIAEDITERKQAEDALRRSEDHFRMVINTIPTMAWSMRPDGVVDFLNQRWLDYAGLTLEQYVQDPTRPVHPADLPRVMEKWLRDMAAGEPNEDEIRLRRADGEYHWFLVRNAPLHDEHGNLVKWYGVSIDIEDRKRAEEKLKHSERQLAEAQRLAHVGGWEWDLRSNSIIWSDELYRIFGLPPGRIKLAGDATPFIHPEDRDLVFGTVKRALSNKEPYSFCYRVLRPDGTERIVQSHGSVLSDEHGEPIRIFGATQDVTEFKRAEEKLKATTEQLRALSASVQSAREAEAARIAREIHDELGSALTSLKLDLELIRRKDFPATGEAELFRFREKIKTMMQLIDQTIDIVRKVSAELRPSVLDDLGLVAAIRWQAQQFEAQAGIVCHYNFSVEDVELDPQQSTAVFRVFQEALTNVARHAEATRIDITLDNENDDLVLTIRDNGRGITADEKADRRSLGLLGMQERVNLIGGSIHATGVEGHGTVIMVRVPVQDDGIRNLT